MTTLLKPIQQAFWLCNLALALALTFHSVFLGDQALFQSQPASEVPGISVKEASRSLDEEGTIFVDARPAEIYSHSHIPAAISMPVHSELSPVTIASLRKAKQIIVYCDGRQCRAAESLAQKLASGGVGGIVVLRDGWQGWLNESQPVELESRP